MNLSREDSSPYCAKSPKQNKPSTVIALAEAFEQAFGFSFHNIYDRQCELFKRKPYNLTKTLDALKGVLVKEARKRGSDK